MALPLPASQRAVLARYLAQCAQLAPEFTWVHAQNLHLTLRFLGGVDDEALSLLLAGLAAIRSSRPRLALAGLGTFGGRARARVVWLGLGEGAGACASLARLVEAACQQAGLAAEERPFRSHLTLARARARGGSRLAGLPEPPALPAWTASTFTLFESHQGRPAPLYEPVQVFPIRSR